MEYIFTIGLVLLILGLMFLKNRISYIKKGNKAIASVIKIRKHVDSDDATCYTPTFTFTTHNNEELEFEGPGSNRRKKWSLGKEIKIVYNGANPKEVLLLTYFQAFGLSLILLTLALVLLFIIGGYCWSEYFFNSLH